MPTVTWLSWPSFVAEVSSRVWLERTTLLSGSNLSEVWVTRLKSKSAATCTREWPGPTTEDTIALDLVAQPLFVRRLPFVGADIAAVGIVAGAVGEQLSLLVDDRDALRPQAVDGGRDQMPDGAHLLRLERAAHLQHDRCRRVELVAREQRPLRHHQMHAGILHAVDRADGARQLALQRAQIVDVLDEARGAERVGLVENLVADAAALGQAAFGQAMRSRATRSCGTMMMLPSLRSS